MMVCEFLHITPSKLRKLLKKPNGIVDFYLIQAYIAKKAQIEQEEIERTKNLHGGSFR